MEEKGEEKN